MSSQPVSLCKSVRVTWFCFGKYASSMLNKKAV
jgi:hypothetical protein